ncbi:hypothetical protein EDB84DRAFT_1567566 [Lactarius hengduanensis]|nr:hypothetical protein EDB84DRAFT_1567566 [Lactarius hengduanensis]
MTSPASVTVGLPQEGFTTGGSYSLMLTGIVIKSDPRGSFKPSRVIILLVNDEPRPASFQLRETQSTLAWAVNPAVVITAKSIISIQPFEARTLMRTRRKAEAVTIQGDVVFRFCSASPRTGDKHEYERICTEFKVILSVVVQRYLEDKTRSSPGGLVMPGEIVFSSSPIAQNSFKLALDALIELMKLISYDQTLYKTAGETRDALQTACGLMPTDRVEDDIQHLGEQICEMLSEMCLQKHSERLASQPQTVTSLLKLFDNPAVFAADCSNSNRKEFRGSDSWRDTLQDFSQQFMRSKRNFFAGKDIYEGAKPYIRKQDALTHPLVEETRSEVITDVITCNVLAIPGSGPILTTLSLAPDEDAELVETLEPVIQTSHLNLRCLDSTRGKLLSKIISWFESDTDPNVLWLSGAPGTGKTAIAWSLVSELKNQQRSAGAFFFGQYVPFPYQLWTTLAYEMTRFHPALRREIYKTAIRNDTTDLYGIQMTFEKLIAGPLKALDARLSRHGPILLIDGLERCAGYGGLKEFLDTLPQWLLLPHHCKLIVISRPQGDIAKVFEGEDITRFQLLTGDDVDSDTKNDVHSYLLHRFAEMRKKDKSISENWPDHVAVSRLADHASGFSKWAAIAVDSIKDSADRKKQLTTILEGGTTTTFNPLDQYFEGALSVAFDDDSPEAFRTTIGTIALSKGPLTMADLEQILQDRFPSNPNRFHIDRAKVHRNTTISCLKIMRQGLKFNICGLKSSYHRNHEIEEKRSLIDRCIPSHLAYACQFWADHLRGVSSTEKRDTEIVNLLRNFFNFHLLYWLEVLSLLSKSNIASKSLLTAAEWLEGTDKDLSLFAADGSRFSLAFADVIAESIPHIYLSALPFSPPSSQVYKRYHDQFPRTINVIHEDGVKWSAMRFSIPTNNAVYSISIHPDGKKIAAGMSSSEAVVISVTTGRTLCQLGGHESNIRTVAYSPSGKRIATGCDDRRLRIFESENGALLFGPFELHSDWIRSLAWSPDGQRIVTGSDDKKVKVVAAETGHVIYDTAFHDDWVRTVICTTEFVISGSDDRQAAFLKSFLCTKPSDRTVRIIDAATGAMSGEAWTTGQTGYIIAIAVSPASAK